MHIEWRSLKILTDTHIHKIAMAKIQIDAQHEEEQRYRGENERDDDGCCECDPTGAFVRVGSERSLTVDEGGGCGEEFYGDGWNCEAGGTHWCDFSLKRCQEWRYKADRVYDV